MGSPLHHRNFQRVEGEPASESGRRCCPAATYAVLVLLIAVVLVWSAVYFRRGVRPNLFTPEENQTTFFSMAEFAKVENAMLQLQEGGQRNVIAAMYSEEMLNLTNNWLCSLAARQANVEGVGLLVFAIDTDCTGLNDAFRKAGGVGSCVPVIPTETPPAATGNVGYENERYIFMCRLKLALFSAAMDVALGGDLRIWLLFSDVDVVIKGDVFRGALEEIFDGDPAWKTPAAAAAGGGSGSDTALPRRLGQEEGQRRHIRSDLHGANSDASPSVLFQQNDCVARHINTGFYYVRADQVGHRLLHGALGDLVAGRTYDNADQGAMKALIAATMQEEQWPIRFLPCSQFPNGHEYFRQSMHFDDVVAIHANWILTSDLKIPCLQVSGNWYMATNGECAAPLDVPWHAQLDAEGRVINCLIGSVTHNLGQL